MEFNEKYVRWSVNQSISQSIIQSSAPNSMSYISPNDFISVSVFFSPDYIVEEREGGVGGGTPFT